MNRLIRHSALRGRGRALGQQLARRSESGAEREARRISCRPGTIPVVIRRAVGTPTSSCSDSGRLRGGRRVLAQSWGPASPPRVSPVTPSQSASEEADKDRTRGEPRRVSESGPSMSRLIGPRRPRCCRGGVGAGRGRRLRRILRRGTDRSASQPAAEGRAAVSVRTVIDGRDTSGRPQPSRRLSRKMSPLQEQSRRQRRNRPATRISAGGPREPGQRVINGLAGWRIPIPSERLRSGKRGFRQDGLRAKCPIRTLRSFRVGA